MKVLICLTVFLFVYERDWNLDFLADTKFICADSSEKIEDKRLIAWIGFRDRDFAFPIFGKQKFHILSPLVNGGFLRFTDWSLLPRKPPNA
ncbi:hypothetical protein KJ841_01530 [Patescibacteria group bacterium]|nr:hypothetical protein [Patescibacteria group bacterium]